MQGRCFTYDKCIAERHRVIRILYRCICHTSKIQTKLGVEQVRIRVVASDDDEGQIGSTGFHFEKVGDTTIGFFEDGTVGGAANLIAGKERGKEGDGGRDESLCV